MADTSSAKKGTFFVAVEQAGEVLCVLKTGLGSTQEASSWAKSNIGNIDKGTVVRVGKFTSSLRPAFQLKEEDVEPGEQEPNEVKAGPPERAPVAAEDPAGAPPERDSDEVDEQRAPVAVAPQIAQEAPRATQAPPVAPRVVPPAKPPMAAPRAPVAARPAVPKAIGPIRPPAPPPRPVPAAKPAVPAVAPAKAETGDDSSVI